MFDFNYRLLRVTAESITAKLIRDLKNDTSRSIRKAIDFGSTFAKSELQKEFFNMARDVASLPRNPFHQLIKRGVHSVDDAVFKTIGVNLGITSFTYGARQIRKQNAENGAVVSWLQEFDLTNGDNAPSVNTLEITIKHCMEMGSFAFAIRLDSEKTLFLPVLRVAARCKDCTFVCAVDARCIGEEEAAAIYNAKNAVILLNIGHDASADSEQKRAEAFRILREHRLLYGFLFRYGEGAKADLTDEFLKEMIRCGCFTGVYAGPKDKAREADSVYRYICASREEGEDPILLFDYRRDAEYIQKLILHQCHFSYAGH